MDPNSVMAWIQVGTTLIQLGKARTDRLRQSVADDPNANLEQLDILDADYQRRIDRRTEDQ